MSDQENTGEQLVQELADVRRRLETSETEQKRIQEELEQEMQDHGIVEAALRQSKEEYHQIFDAIADSLFVSDLEGRIVAANSAACEAHGYTQEELIGLPIKKIIHPDYHDQFNGLRAQAEVGSHFRAEGPHIRKDGSTFDIEVFGRPFIYKGIPHLLAIVRDVTERNRAEEVLERERQDLKRSLEASDRDRQLIAYEIHDGVAQQLTGAMMQFQAFTSLQSQNAEQASNAFNTGSELLREALAEARRLIRGVRPPILDELGLVTAVEHLAKDITSEGGPSIQCDVDVEFDRLSHSLENGLFRIVQESLTNACKHSESDKVLVTMVQEGSTLHIEVQDWGLGFDVESTEKGRFGLESIRRRARLLDGQAIIESKPGVGTRVVVELPLP